MAIIKAPASLDDFVFPNADARRVVQNIVTQKFAFPLNTKNGIILEGVVGTGKSTCAELIPDAMERTLTGTKAQSRIEHVRAPNNGVGLLSNITSGIGFIPANGNQLHYVILHEVDQLTKDAREELRSLMDYAKANAVFIMTTNHLDKIENSVQDRSRCISFNPSNPNVFVPAVQGMLSQCGIDDPQYHEAGYIHTKILGRRNNLRAAMDAVQDLYAELNQ